MGCSDAAVPCCAWQQAAMGNRTSLLSLSWTVVQICLKPIELQADLANLPFVCTAEYLYNVVFVIVVVPYYLCVVIWHYYLW